jgi:hypothetical protein
MKSFSIREVLQTSFGLFKQNWKGMLVVFAAMLVVGFVPSVLASVFQESLPWLSILISIISWVLSFVTGVGILKVAIDVVDGRGAQVTQLFYALRDWKLILRYLGTSIVFGFAVFAVSVLPALVIFGVGFVVKFSGSVFLGTLYVFGAIFLVMMIYLSVRMQFWTYVLVDKGLWGREALAKSLEMTKGLILKLILFSVALLVLNLVGAILLVVGLFVTVPVSMLAMAVVYRKLEHITYNV